MVNKNFTLGERIEGKLEGGWLKRLYYGLIKTEGFLGNFLLLAIRLYWGGSLVFTGLGKLMNAERVGDYFASLGVPAAYFFAYLIGLTEMIGGASLFIGLFSRLMSVFLVCLLFGAYGFAFPEALSHVFSQPSAFISKDPFLFLFASLIIFCFGPGFISFDYWIEKKTYGKAL